MAVVRALGPEEALQETGAQLGLRPDADRASFLAESVRRTASVRCPSTPQAIIEAVHQVLDPLMPLTKEEVSEAFDAVVAVGDLVEVIDPSGGQRRRLIYLGPPRYVQRSSGDLLLLGVRPDAAPLVGEGLIERVQVDRHLRRLVSPTAEELELVSVYGLDPIREDKWMRHAPPQEATQFIEIYTGLLARQGPSGEIPGLRILDATSSPAYYRGRWRPSGSSDSGVYVARRSQGYGADLWCVVELRDGHHVRLLDLPSLGRDRGCDEAWHLQAAIDAQQGAPQEVIVRRTGTGRIQLGLPAPPPRWLQRRWDLLGNPAEVRSALFGYEFSPSDTRAELEFVKDHLWMSRRVLDEEATNE